MYEWMQSLLNNTGFMPHGHCFLWTSSLLKIYVIADVLIIIAYYSIPFAIWSFMRQRQDLRYRAVFIGFGAFIFACGTTHLISLWNIWNYAYWLEGIAKLITGIISFVTAILVWFLIPKALAIPSRESLQHAYHQLEKTHQDLSRKDQSYHLLIETLAEGLWLLDSHGITTGVNKRMAEMLGYDEREVMGQPLYAFMEDNSVAYAHELMHRRMEGISERHEFTFKRRNGEPLYAIVSSTPLRDSRGKVTGAMSLVTDITEREKIAQELTRLTTQQEILIKQRTQALSQREQKLRAIIHANIDAIITIDSMGIITSANPATETMFGYSQTQLLDNNVAMLMPTPQAVQHDQYLTHYLRGGTPGVIGKRREMEGKRANGDIFPLELAVSEVKSKQEHFFVGMLRDISERKQAQEAIEELNTELRETNNNLSTEIRERKKAEDEAKNINAKLEIFIRDLQSYTDDIHQLNEMSDFLQACNNLHELTDVINTFAQRFFNSRAGALYLIHDEKLELYEKGWGEGFNPWNRFLLSECWAMRNSKIHPSSKPQENLICQHFHSDDDKAHTCIPLYARAKQVGLLVLYAHSPLWSDNPAHNANRAQLLQAFADHIAGAISNQNLRALLQDQSTRDPLTGLHNRRFLNEQMQLEISRCQREERSFGILLADIDHFKAINDNFGHDVGDRVLTTIAAQLHSGIRASDILCRFGGEEFVVLLPDADLKQAQVIAEKLRLRIAQLPDDLKLNRPTTLSIGVAAYPAHGSSIEDLIKAADTALYEAKRTGRNRCVLASSEQP